jgi:hypothetical protein
MNHDPSPAHIAPAAAPGDAPPRLSRDDFANALRSVGSLLTTLSAGDVLGRRQLVQYKRAGAGRRSKDLLADSCSALIQATIFAAGDFNIPPQFNYVRVTKACNRLTSGSSTCHHVASRKD